MTTNSEQQTSILPYEDETNFSPYGENNTDSSDYTINEDILKIRHTIERKIEEILLNRAIDENWLIGLVTAYVILILVGAFVNGLICIAVTRKAGMKTERNMLILNLAILGLFICFFTMPFSLVEVSVKYWSLGLIGCKLVACLQETSAFVSAFSITAIALVQYKVILNPNQETFSSKKMLLKLISIWAVGILFSSPLLYSRQIDRHYTNLPQVPYVDFCYEKWTIEHGFEYYIIFTMIFQYIIPIIILSLVCTRVCEKTKSDVGRRKEIRQKMEKSEHIDRTRRTKVLLISIVTIFGMSWLPLCIVNLVLILYNPLEENVYRIIFAVCQMIEMSSACSIPLLFCWLDSDFKNEFKQLFAM